MRSGSTFRLERIVTHRVVHFSLFLAAIAAPRFRTCHIRSPLLLRHSHFDVLSRGHGFDSALLGMRIASRSSLIRQRVDVARLPV